jgi:hypothetical protein
MTHFRQQLLGAYKRGWAESFAKTVTDLQTTGIKMKDGRTARMVFEPAPIDPTAPVEVLP